MKRLLLAFAALMVVATPLVIHQGRAQAPAPAGGAPEVQAPVPEVGPGRGSGNQPGTGNANPPVTTGPAAQTTAQQPAAPIPQRAPTPVQATPAPPPLSDRGQTDAAELELQAALRGERIEGRITIPDAQARSLVQPEGRDWRRFHNVTLAWIGGIAVLGMLGLLALFYLLRGRIRPENGMSGRTLHRFNWFERGVHWMTAGSFIVLMLSGLNLTFGRWLILPIIGPEAFTALSQAGKTAHNFLGFPFTLGIVLMFLVWVRDNIPNRLDLEWIRKGGGFVGAGHPPAKRFNAGQKVVFWVTVGGGALVAASGYMLVFPFAVTDIWGMQVSHMVHGVLSVLMVAAMLAHIYIGSVGMEGAIDAMSKGTVDYNWAREHHSLWVEEEMAKAHATIVPAARPASAD